MSGTFSNGQIATPAKWTEGYKYQLVAPVRYMTKVYPKRSALNGFIEWHADGTVILKAGYASDGPTGVLDHPCSKRAADLHDAGYQFLRQGKLPVPGDMSESVFRKAIDDEFLRILKHDARFAKKWRGFHGAFAYVLWLGVRVFGQFYASPEAKRKVHTFPEV